MLVFGFLISAMIRSGLGHEVDGNIGAFIADVTGSLHSGSSFTAYLCTNRENTIRFSGLMSRSYLLHGVDELSGDHEFRHVDSVVAHRNFYVLDLDCPGADRILSEGNSRGMFAAPTKWLLLQDFRNLVETRVENNQSSLRALPQDLRILPDSEIIVGQRTGEDAVRLLSVYRPSYLHELVIEKLGMWSGAEGLQLAGHDVLSKRRTNLQETLLRASVVVTNPDSVNHLEDFTDTRIDVISKFSLALSKLLAARMNATVNFTYTPTWGYQDQNGTWSGMIGEIYHGRADFGATATFIVPSRLDVVQYLQLYTPDSAKFIFRRPSLSYVSNLFTLPFAKSVWIAGMISCWLGLVILYLSMKWEWKMLENVPQEEKLSGDLQSQPTVGDNLLVLVGAVTQQGSWFEPRSVPARIVTFIILLLCLNLYAAYTANIVALLQSSSNSIKNIQDLMNSPLKIGLLDVVYNRYYFGAFEDSLRREFYERRVKNQKNIWMSLEEGVSRVRNELFAFQTDLTAGYAVVQMTFGEDEKCGFEEIDYFYVSHPLFCVRRHSPYNEIFRVGGLWLGETGLKERYSKLLYNSKPVCNGRHKFVSVGPIECYAAYVTMGCGMALTLVIFILEVAWSRSIAAGELEETNASIEDSSGPEAWQGDDRSEPIESPFSRESHQQCDPPDDFVH